MRSPVPGSSKLLERLPPFLTWWSKVTRRSLKADFLTGATDAIVALH